LLRHSDRVETTAPQATAVSDLNAVLARLELSSVPVDKWALLRTA